MFVVISPPVFRLKLAVTVHQCGKEGRWIASSVLDNSQETAALIRADGDLTPGSIAYVIGDHEAFP